MNKLKELLAKTRPAQPYIMILAGLALILTTCVQQKEAQVQEDPIGDLIEELEYSGTDTNAGTKTACESYMVMLEPPTV